MDGGVAGEEAQRTLSRQVGEGVFRKELSANLKFRLPDHRTNSKLLSAASFRGVNIHSDSRAARCAR